MGCLKENFRRRYYGYGNIWDLEFMKKMNSTYGWAIGVFVLFPLFVFVWNKITVKVNDINPDIFHSFLNNMQKVEVRYKEGDDQFSSKTVSYKTGTNIYFTTAKARFGSYRTRIFKDSSSQKYYALYFFDEDVFYTKSSNISRELHRQPFYVWVNKDDLQNPELGTKEKPYPVFKYRGKEKPFTIFVPKEDEKGNLVNDAEGHSVYVYENIEPTKDEYKYYVVNYLAYAMPKEEFNKRFAQFLK